MAGSPKFLILISLLSQLSVLAVSGGLKKKVSALGGSVTFSVNFTDTHIDSIVWIFNSSPIVTIQPAVGDKNPNIIVTQNRNKKRVVFPDGSYSLKLTKLMKNDSGIYRVEIHSSSSLLPSTQEYGLHVYEHLSKPKVTRGLQNIKNGTCNANLTCSVEQGGEDVRYSWKVLGPGGSTSHNGSVLPISWRPGENDMTFICMARNPISNSSSSPILAWRLCKDAGGGGSDSSAIFLYLLLVPFLLCILLLALSLMMRAEKVKEPIEGNKGMDIHQEIPNVCLHSGESTVYEIISHANKTNPKEDLLSTLYSTVQIPKTVENPCSQPSTTPDTPRLFSYENVI